VGELLAQARALAAAGEDSAARNAFVAILQRDPTHLAALNELGNLAFSGGYRAAACSAYRQAIQHHPQDALVRVNLGNALAADQDHAGALQAYEAALAIDPQFSAAHRGIGTLLQDLDPERAEVHLARAFAGSSMVSQPYRGSGTGVPLLLLVSARGGNIPVQSWINDRDFAITAVYMESWREGELLPAHALICNAVGDADRCPLALRRAAVLVARATVPVINDPAAVARTGRVEGAHRLAGLPDVVTPRTQLASAADLEALPAGAFPLLLRRPGFHTGRHFLRVDAAAGLAAALQSLGEGPLIAIQYLDVRGADGLARKFRVLFVDGTAYPVHLAISADWKVHYFTAEMSLSQALRDEERCFLEDMPAVLGRRGVAALDAIRGALQLEYAGVDFALAPDGRVVVFEANATMVVAKPGPEPIWDYRRPALDAVTEAARAMLLRRVRTAPGVRTPRRDPGA
jgi:tetratricopeptide (TPR) repeat protein